MVLTLLGWLGTALVVLAYAQPDARRLRMISLVASLALIVFNAGLGIWSNVALEVVLVAINLARLRPTRRVSAPPEPELALVG